MPIPATKDIPQKDSPWLSLILGVLLFAFCYFAGEVCTGFVQYLGPGSIGGDRLQLRAGRDNFRLIQAVWTLVSSGMVVFFWGFYSQPFSHFILEKRSPKAIFWLICLAFGIVSVPLMDWLFLDPEVLPISEGLQLTLREEEAKLSDQYFLLMGDQDLLGLLTNLIVICVLPAFLEEFLFRQYLTSTLMRILPTHAAIWLGAAAFSAVHFSVLGFLPRLMLGAVFGYLMWWTGNIRLSIFAHFLNNFIFLVIGIFILRGDFPESWSNFGKSSWGLVLLSALCSLSLLLIFARLSGKKMMLKTHE